jgi:ferredoxin-NADP reductase
MIEVTVKDKDVVAGGVVALTLNGVDLPKWTPGAHIDFEPREGLVRQYSLCGSPDDPSWRVAVLREPDGRGGSAYVHDSLAVGDRVRVSEPRNTFPLVPASRYLFIAGGIGITPLLPMIAAVAAQGRTGSSGTAGGRRSRWRSCRSWRRTGTGCAPSRT